MTSDDANDSENLHQQATGKLKRQLSHIYKTGIKEIAQNN